MGVGEDGREGVVSGAVLLDQGRGSTGATWGRSCGNLRLGAQYLPRSAVNLAVQRTFYANAPPLR